MRLAYILVFLVAESLYFHFPQPDAVKLETILSAHYATNMFMMNTDTFKMMREKYEGNCEAFSLYYAKLTFSVRYIYAVATSTRATKLPCKCMQAESRRYAKDQ